MKIIKALLVAGFISLLTNQVSQAAEPTAQAILNHHLASFGAGDVAAIMEDYTDNSVIVLPTATLKGREQIKGLFDGFVAEFSKPGTVFNLTGSTVVDNVAYITWTADTPDNTYSFASDTFFFHDGKIGYQTVALVVAPK